MPVRALFSLHDPAKAAELCLHVGSNAGRLCLSFCLPGYGVDLFVARAAALLDAVRTAPEREARSAPIYVVGRLRLPDGQRGFLGAVRVSYHRDRLVLAFQVVANDTEPRHPTGFDLTISGYRAPRLFQQLLAASPSEPEPLGRLVAPTLQVLAREFEESLLKRRRSPRG